MGKRIARTVGFADPADFDDPAAMYSVSSAALLPLLARYRTRPLLSQAEREQPDPDPGLRLKSAIHASNRMGEGSHQTKTTHIVDCHGMVRSADVAASTHKEDTHHLAAQ